jgi:hypothetical protein
LCCCKCKEEEQKRANELTQEGDEVHAESVWKPSESRQPFLTRMVRIGMCSLHLWQDQEAFRRSSGEAA